MDIVPSWLRTESSPVWTVQRLALAAVVLPFGLQSGAIATAPMTAFVAATVCALLLVLGLGTRIAAVGVAALVVVSLVAGQSPALGILALALSFGLVARGGGAGSFDDVIVRQLETLPLEQEMTADGGIVGRRVGEYGT